MQLTEIVAIQIISINYKIMSVKPQLTDPQSKFPSQEGFRWSLALLPLNLENTFQDFNDATNPFLKSDVSCSKSMKICDTKKAITSFRTVYTCWPCHSHRSRWWINNDTACLVFIHLIKLINFGDSPKQCPY